MARAHFEDDIQMAIVQHLKLRGVPGAVWFHVPNGGRRNPREAARFKQLGVRAGVSDLILVHDKNIFALELKAPRGRASESQLEFIRDMKNAGAKVCIAEGIDKALDALESWGLLRGTARMLKNALQ
jgi:hypothetical protein